MQTKRVVVAIVQDAANQCLITFNEKWNGYAFPMRDIDEDQPPLGSVAIAAVEADLKRPLPHASAQEVEYLGQYGESGRTGQGNMYQYWAFTVDPGEPLKLPKAGSPTKKEPAMENIDALLTQTDVTWSTQAIARELAENREVALAVLTRLGEKETEYLVVWSESYGGFFFPAMRVKKETKPEAVVKEIVRDDLGLRDAVVVEWKGEVSDVHFSARFARDTQFRFHVCAVQIPTVDLHQPFNPLEMSLSRRGKEWAWMTADQLGGILPLGSGGKPPQLSPTMSSVREAVLTDVPRQMRAAPLRFSEGGLALASRKIGGETQWLAQWNDNWKAFFFVGGHREPGESFRECVIREVCEELDLRPADVKVGPSPVDRLQYQAISRSAGELTAYTMELFEVLFSANALAKIEAKRENRWLTAQEIRRLEATDARAISPTVQSLLLMVKRI